MNTKELVNRIRFILLEYSTDPVSDLEIIEVVNQSYRFCINSLAKSDEEYFGEVIDFPVTAGQLTYALPENLWNKRVETMLIPTPPNNSNDPWSYTPVKRRQFKNSYMYQTTKIRTYYPECFCILGNVVYILPSPLMSYTAKLVVSPKMPMLGVYGGRITGFQNNNQLVLDELNDERLADNASDNTAAFLSVCDGQTGENKAIWSYSTVDETNKIITLQANPRKYATLKITNVGSILYTAKTSGTAGQSISVTHTETGGAVSVTASGNNITVSGTFAALTAAQIITQFSQPAAAAALALVTPTEPTTTPGIVKAQAKMYLSGGEAKYMGQDVDDPPTNSWSTIMPDDIVTYGWTTGYSMLGDAFDTLLIDWSVLRLRGMMNEDDPQTLNSMKLQLQELAGDLAGRPVGAAVQRTVRGFFAPRMAVRR